MTSPTSLALKVFQLDIGWPHPAFGICGSWPVKSLFERFGPGGWVVIHQPSFWSPLLESFYASMWTNISRIFNKSSLRYHVIWRNSIEIPYLQASSSLRSSPHPHLCKRKQPSLVGWSPSLGDDIALWKAQGCFFVGSIFLWSSLPARHWIELLLGSDASAQDSVAWYLHHKTFTCKKWSEWSKITWHLAGMLRKLVQEFHNLSQSFT